jgi:hypothetical protein
MFDRLMQLDRLQVTVIVDNESDGLSPPCRCCDASATPAADRAAKYTSEVSVLPECCQCVSERSADSLLNTTCKQAMTVLQPGLLIAKTPPHTQILPGAL